MPLLLLTSLALAMDSVAVAIGIGMTQPKVTWAQALKLAGVFGLLQGLMPVLGFALGGLFREQIQDYDHWVAFGILLLLGFKMLRESRDDEEMRRARPAHPFRLKRLIVLGLATSLDALAVGITFSLLSGNLLAAALSIGGTTFALCVFAVWLGKRLGLAMANRAELAGGLLLIAIGGHILYSHLA